MANPEQPRVCILGSINMDLVMRAPRLPGAGETILGGPFATFPGGKGANQAVAAARMGAAVSLVAAVGGDDHGRALLGVLNAEGVDTARVCIREGSATGVAAITVADDGGNTIIVAGGANHTLTPGDVRAARDSIAAADVLVMQLEIPLETAASGAALARDTGTTVILNAAPAPEAGLPPELLAAADVLIVNDSEARVLGKSGEADHDALLARLSVLGPRATIITLGVRGAKYEFDGQPAGGVSAFPVEAVDTVGAGDAFVGAFATRWAELQIADALDAMGVLDAMCWGAAAGALATTRAGAMPSLPGRAEIVRLLRQHGG